MKKQAIMLIRIAVRMPGICFALESRPPSGVARTEKSNPPEEGL